MQEQSVRIPRGSRRPALRINSARSDAFILQDARYVIKSVICDPNFEGLVLGCIDANLLQPDSRWKVLDANYQNCIRLNPPKRKIFAIGRQNVSFFQNPLLLYSQHFSS